MSNQKLQVDKRVYQIDEFCEAFAIGRTKCYGEMKEGRLKSLTVGSRRLIPVEFAESWLANLMATTPIHHDT